MERLSCVGVFGSREQRRWLGAAAACAALLAAVTALAATAGRADAAKLVGGRMQTQIHRAFFARHSHRGQLITSIRQSTVQPAWAVVKSVVPEKSGRTNASAHKIRLRTTFYRRVHGAERPGTPPKPARADLTHRFTVDVRYSGSGSETIGYNQQYQGVCLGEGGFNDQQLVTVQPMSWVVRYEIDPDALLSAVRGKQGPVLVPRVKLLKAGSQVTATEKLSRAVVDLSCAGKTSRWNCTRIFHLGSGTGLLSFPASAAMEIGIPLASKGTGQCDDADYTLGQSQWDAGNTTALLKSLGVVGGTLAANPYKPLSVAWPRNAASQINGFGESPCQGDGAACSDTFAWKGKVQLSAAAGG